MSDTPLSDFITMLIEDSSDKLTSEFYQAFLVSDVGLIMSDMPDLVPGSTFTISGETITSSLVSDSDGNSLIKVCADPDVFEK